MAHEIDRILAAAAGSDWLIEQQKAEEIVGLLALRAANGAGPGWDGEAKEPEYAAEPLRSAGGTIHRLALRGTIFPRAGMMSMMSGGASLESFGRAFDAAAADTAARAIVIDVDSPGGVVDMVEETAAKVHAARRADRPIIAVANTMMASAAYWIGSAADEVVASPSGTVGSIGVYGMHDDMTAAFERMGVKRTVIRAGARKAEGVFGPLDKAAMAHRQKQTAQTYASFVAAVARHRGVAEDVVRADPETADRHMGGGRAYRSAEAVTLGMADRVATMEEVLRELMQAPGRSSAVARARLSLTL